MLGLQGLRRRGAGLLLLLLCATACRNVTPPAPYFDSEPPGAEVLVDGRRTGFVTPCHIALSRGSSHRITLVLPGYLPKELELRRNGRAEYVTWDEGAMAPVGIVGPFGLEARDLFTPREKNSAHAPNRVFVRLEPAGRE